MEIWKAIEGYEGLYEVSTHGNIRSLDRTYSLMSRWGKLIQRKKKGKIKNQRVSTSGYFIVDLYNHNRVSNTYSVHRLVSKAFIPNPNNKREVNHINFIKTDNCVDNLEWVTPMENAKHASENNLTHVGERCHMSKLSENDVLKIRQLIKEGKLLQREIGKMYGVGKTTISMIKTNNNWKQLK